MALLPTHESLEGKANAFEQIILKTKKDVNNFIGQIRQSIIQKDNRDLIYRGVADARYKIFNSAQRHYAEKELRNITTYDNLISGLIQEALTYQNQLLKKFTG